MSNIVEIQIQMKIVVAIELNRIEQRRGKKREDFQLIRWMIAEAALVFSP